MDYSPMVFLFRVGILLITFFVFVGVVNFGLKKQLNYGRIAIAGFLIGILISLSIVVSIVIIEDIVITNYSFLIVSSIGEGIVSIIAFIVLYIITQLIYKRIKKNKSKKKEIEEPFKVKIE